MKRSILFIILLLAFYTGSYLFFRQSHTEFWPQDKKIYVIFPKDKPYLYYFWRPLTYLDASLTDMKFHIGRHR